MKIITLFAAIVLTGAMQLCAQDQKTQDPDEQIIVNKKYDEQGNLIEYDSTYVHQWSTDSTLRFSMPEGLFSEEGFPDLNSFMKQFFNDSTINGMKFPDHFGLSPFGFEDDPFHSFQFLFPDSLFQGFSHSPDSMFLNFRNDSTGFFSPGFSFPGIDAIRKRFQENFNQWPGSGPEALPFKNEDQKKEWEELMKKHQKEMDVFQKKWKEQ